MNRAWIPAGALAGVSVAGLLALAPLTDSLGTQVTFDPNVQVSPALTKPLRTSVPVSVNLGPTGTVSTTAAYNARGGVAARTSTSSDAGLVGVRVKPKATTTTPSAPTTPTETRTAPKAEPKTEEDIKPKKQQPRQESIGGNSGVNSSEGLAGGNDTATGVGEQSNTPG